LKVIEQLLLGLVDEAVEDGGVGGEGQAGDGASLEVGGNGCGRPGGVEAVLEGVAVGGLSAAFPWTLERYHVDGFARVGVGGGGQHGVSDQSSAVSGWVIMNGLTGWKQSKFNASIPL
jgi:hypothetical protein